MINTPRDKPVGRTGPIQITAEGLQRQLVSFPADKEARERMIADLFVGNVARFDAEIGPLTNLVQNPEDDLDFTVQTGLGPKLLELAEFAPLSDLGVRYDNAPRQFSKVPELATLYHRLIMNKSAHQGGPDRWLLTYKTHDAFFVPPLVQELERRMLEANPPRFERVYFLSPHDATGATVFTIYPGRPHSFFTEMSNDRLAAMSLHRVDFDQM